MAKSFLADDELLVRISSERVRVFTASDHLSTPLTGIRAYLLAGTGEYR
jgi:hypothetical protein